MLIRISCRRNSASGHNAVLRLSFPRHPTHRLCPHHPHPSEGRSAAALVHQDEKGVILSIVFHLSCGFIRCAPPTNIRIGTYMRY